jgi:hypothetical protein
MNICLSDLLPTIQVHYVKEWQDKIPNATHWLVLMSVPQRRNLRDHNSFLLTSHVLTTNNTYVNCNHLCIDSGSIMKSFLWNWCTFCGRQKLTSIHLLTRTCTSPVEIRSSYTDFKLRARVLRCKIRSNGVPASSGFSPSGLHKATTHVEPLASSDITALYNSPSDSVKHSCPGPCHGGA